MYKHLIDLRSARRINNLIEQFDQIIVLSRRDRLAQAISAMKGIQTGQWESIVTADKSTDVVLDPIFVSDRIRRFLANQRTINGLLDDIDRPKLFLEYEEIRDSLETVWQDVQRFLALEHVPLSKVSSSLKRQADSTSEMLAEQYIRFIRGLKATGQEHF